MSGVIDIANLEKETKKIGDLLGILYHFVQMGMLSGIGWSDAVETMRLAWSSHHGTIVGYNKVLGLSPGKSPHLILDYDIECSWKMEMSSCFDNLILELTYNQCSYFDTSKKCCEDFIKRSQRSTTFEDWVNYGPYFLNTKN